MDLMARRRIMMEKKALPYDAEIEYICNGSSNNLCKIDTGISLGTTPNLKIQTKIWRNSFSGNYKTFIRSESGIESENTIRIIGTNRDDNKAYVTTGGKQDSSLSFDFSKKSWHDVVLDTLTKKATIDGTTKTQTNIATSTTNSNIILFGNENQEYNTRFAFFKAWSGNTLILDFIPVRVGQVGYMYDKVSGQLFGNAETGSFILGPDKT